ncbi:MULTISPECIES: glycosyltransferase [Streptomyces]|uniref:Cell wall biosynthesis glycosyltransferase n=1 Tax=Streptomyces sviceus (strain ATCC 29083 / DSM 924 / JCM 4929 / NBRC 13980 / NCIMB 11184 / NRRL 5439 / UC 5370) TaxID=463191 RepID=B5HXA9_STRX2|nr:MULTISPECIES: glycosyltransferase [Streptomyces]EDY57464.1 cell wall biosynthesis glycosyltransferase [Streptomyces sviceus ATCC 29083]MYT05789.1 glycosyltransferase [Streptomyces sp. SID5470]
MTVKVSVVIAVYNPGKYVEDCITGLLRQSLTPDEFEVFFVNDGSTDETPARLDQLAAEHPHFHLIHQESSGWSGKPRNTGIEAAQGEYVMFVDHDDWLGDEALERMYDYGKANEADVVVGKMAGIGRPVPQELFRVNRPRATVANAPLIDSLTPHKMFRREFLNEHGIRFKEGRRRLEDHVFVVETYLRAKNVSVLGDYLCYYHITRDDGSNAGFQRFDPVGYFGNLREALDVVEELTEPGALRDKLFSRWLRNEMVERLRGQRLLKLPEDYAEELYTEIHKVVTERFGPGVVARLGLTQKVVAGLIFADRYQDIRTLAEWEAGIKPTGELTSLEWRDGTLSVGFDSELHIGDEPMTFRQEGDRRLLGLPLSDEALKALDDQGIKLDAPLAKSDVDLVVRHREDARQFYLPVKSELHEVPAGDGAFRQRISARAELDPETAASGAPLDKGIWDLHLRIKSCGWSKETRLGAVRGEDVEAGRLAALTGEPARLVLPYWTDGPGNLSLDVDQHTNKLEGEAVAFMPPAEAAVEGSVVRLPLPLHIAATGGDTVQLRFERKNVGKYPADATLDGRIATATLPLEKLTGMRWAVRVGVPSAARGERKWTRLPVDVVVDADGTAKVIDRHTPSATKKAAPSAPKKKAAAPRPLWRRAAGRIKRALTNQKKG